MAKTLNCFPVERFFCSIATYIPRVGVNLIMIWGIYTHAWSICFKEFGLSFWSTVFLVLGVFHYVVATISYYQIVHVGAGSPLDIPGFRRHGINGIDIEEEAAGPPPHVQNNVMSKENGQMRYCTKCDCWKPDRTHHCSACKKCILRMDHHCPWFAACVGHCNHKFFVQFLVHVTILAFWCFISSLFAFRDFLYSEFNDDLHINWIMLMIISGVMGLAVSVFAGFSVYQVLLNKTTLESLEKSHYRSVLPPSAYRYRDAPSLESVGNLFDIGRWNNWKQVMGEHWWEWIFPITPRNHTPGVSFPINPKIWDEIQRQGALEEDMRKQAAAAAAANNTATAYPYRPEQGSNFNPRVGNYPQRDARRPVYNTPLSRDEEESISLMRM